MATERRKPLRYVRDANAPSTLSSRVAPAMPAKQS